eukprot:TRINITY_DN8682_c0_g1_i1.p1 TRINITY_DN8682_c0_g1~~TRINITY_DN8682_c0_g1_i1.p1  ORF type:complete len:137 (-),score=44.49 TRINITY_DN8682_c0_g1_i1:107-517(-)
MTLQLAKDVASGHLERMSKVNKHKVAAEAQRQQKSINHKAAKEDSIVLGGVSDRLASLLENEEVTKTDQDILAEVQSALSIMVLEMKDLGESKKGRKVSAAPSRALQQSVHDLNVLPPLTHPVSYTHLTLPTKRIV